MSPPFSGSKNKPEKKNQREASRKQKSHLTFSGLHCVLSQEIELSIASVVRISDPP
jgi:hypothetical protein